jgi:hypothetical protein
MLLELAVVGVVLVAILLCAYVLAAAGRERLDRRHARVAKAQSRVRVWRDYAAACAPAEAPAPAARITAPSRPAASARAACDQGVGLSAGPAKA